MNSKQLSLSALLALTALAGACSPAENAEAVAGEAEVLPAAVAAVPRVVTVTTTDFAFEAPETLPEGLTTFHLINQGPEAHHVQLVRLEDGYTLEDLAEAMGEGHGMPPRWAHLVGGPNTPMPGADTETTVYLLPGQYALVCIIPSPVDGQPHTAKGMVKPLTVTPAAGADPAAEPHFDVRMELVDYGYKLTGEIGAGRQTIRVETVAEQPHEVVFVKLAPGRAVGEVVAWFAGGMQGPPPAEFVGGTTAMEQGVVNYVTIDFESGADYGLLCFIPDAKDAQPHVAHGMVRQIRVP